MKPRFLLLPLLFLLALGAKPNAARASHAAGGELIYEWISDSTYRFYFKFYRDCDGIPEPSDMTMCYENPCSGISGSLTMPKLTGPLPGGGVNGQEVTTGCPGYATTCGTGTLPGYREWWYTATLTLNGQCNSWKFYAFEAARNASITNLTAPGSQNLYVEATFNNVAAQGNSSPYFSVKPVPYVCVNTPYTYNNGAVDPNADSVGFSIIQPRTVPFCGTLATDIPFSSAAYNLIDNPFGTGNTFSINPTTGELNFTPNALQIAVVTVLVEEFRAGVLIGSVLRDIQIVVIDCDVVQPTLDVIDTTVSGGTIDTLETVYGCATQLLDFDFDINSADDSAVLVVVDNHDAAAPGSTVSYVGMTTDSITGYFTWTPGVLDTGLNILTITVKDSSCRPPGIIIQNTFTIPIYINPVTVARNDTTICPGDSVELDVIGGATFTWVALPGGSPTSSLSCTTCKNPIAKPAVTTYYEVTSNLSSICNKSKDTVLVKVVIPPAFNAGPDTTTCINDSLQLNINLPTGGATTYTIRWSPGSSLTDSTIANPIAFPSSDVTYTVTVTPDGLASCAYTDTLNVAVLQGYTILTPDTAICIGGVVNVRGSGDPRYTYSWTPTTGVTPPNIVNPTIVAPFTLNYTLVASYPGCSDSIHQIAVDVQPIPTATTNADRVVCLGDTVHINTTVTPAYSGYSYTWTPGGNLDDAYAPDPIFTATTAALTVLTLTVQTPAGCKDTEQIVYTVVPSEFMDVNADTAICPRDSVLLITTGAQVDVRWTPALGVTDSTGLSTYGIPTTTTTYTVIGEDIFGCLDTEQVTIVVHPDAVLSLPDSVRIYPGETYQMDPGGNCLYFTWFPDLGLTANNIANPVSSPPVNTRYFVNGRTEAGCATSDTIDVLVSLDSYLDMPNAFSPGSNPNALLKPAKNGFVKLNYFRIYNRWGNMVYQSTDPEAGWDGRYNGEVQPMGVYVYTIEAVTPSGRVINKQGNVTLIR